MPLIQLLEVLVVVGVLLWLVNRFIPMQGSIKSILNGVVVIAVVSARRNETSQEIRSQTLQRTTAGICL